MMRQDYFKSVKVDLYKPLYTFYIDELGLFKNDSSNNT